MNKLDDFKNSKSKSFQRLNPHLYPLAGLSNTQSKHDAVATVAKEVVGKDAVQRRVAVGRGVKPGVRVTIASFRRKACDSDNLIGGSKALRDAIAKTIFPNEPDPDADHLIQWEILQVKTSGRAGTMVMVEELKMNFGGTRQQPGAKRRVALAPSLNASFAAGNPSNDNLKSELVVSL